MPKGVKIVLIIVVVLFVLILIAGWLIGSYFYQLALEPNTDKSMVISAPHNMGEEDIAIEEAYKEKRKQEKEWYNSLNSSDEYIRSDDNLLLHAYKVTNEEDTNRYAILCHGYTSKADEMLSSSRRFYDEGYHLLMPDARGHGESEGDYIGMGWDERLDIVKWIDEIIKEDPDAKIVLYGVSMGAATVMFTSGEELPSNVVAIVEDCGYSSIWEEFSYQLNELFHLPEFPILNFASAVTKIKAGYFLGDGDAVKQVAKSKTPMMFIHGSEDTFVPSYMIDKVYDAANVEKEKLVVSGAVHGASSSVLGDEYWVRVFDFIEKYM